MAQRRKETWLALIVVLVALIPAVILGIWLWAGATAAILHPNPKQVASIAHAAPSPKWAGPVEQGRHIVGSALNEQNLTGLSVAVGVDGEIVWAEGFGWADLENRTPIAPDTTFRIGTASVVLTSAAAGVLLEEGLFQIDDEIQKYVPAFPHTQWPVTLRQLMGHTSGLANDGGDESTLLSKSCGRPVDALQYLSGRARELRFEPGTQFRFSNYGWIVVSAAIEAAADEPFLTFMQKDVFERLGMRDTKAESWNPIPNRATFYFPRFAADPRYGLHLMRPVDYSCYGGASVFLSTPSDLVRFGLAMNEGTLLQPATVKLLQTSQRLASDEDTGYGLGWDLETVPLAGGERRWVGHDGTTLGGMVASLMTLPEHGLAVSVISNISYADTNTVALKIADAFASARTVRR
jgi:serine beta-lactamase-like protein LACTB